jgi:CheY-like chemotaxis protein
MTSGSRILETLFPGSRRTLLTALFREPRRWWTVEELAGNAGARPGGIQAQLARLKESGVVRENQKSGQPHYQPNPECQIYAELHAIVLKLTADSGGETILVVEDTEATAQITCILLKSWGYRTLEAHTPAEALDLFDAHGDGIQLVLTDVQMPQMNGVQLADELRRRNPQLPIVFMSGYPGRELTILDEMFLPKPFNPAGLSQAVRKALDSAGGKRINSH